MQPKAKQIVPHKQQAQLNINSKLELVEEKQKTLDIREKGEIVLQRARGSFSPGSGNEGKKRNRFEQTSRTLQRKISMRSTKDQLVEKDVLMPVKHNVFLWNLPDVEEVPSHDGETV
ncbi:hypothetical protein TNCV_1990201 [Trichonephila clavipes]|nr:hypothetical protein TNCV_1990201 [Trichonephila clavipes]